MAGHLAFLFPMWDIIASQKRTKIYFVLRKLGLNEKLYWMSIFLVGFALAIVSNLLGTIVLKTVVVGFDKYWQYMGFLPWFLIQLIASMSVIVFSIFYGSFISSKGIIAFIVVEFILSYLWWVPFASYNIGTEQLGGASLVIREILYTRIQILHTSGYEIGLALGYALKSISSAEYVSKMTDSPVRYFGLANLFTPFYSGLEIKSPEIPKESSDLNSFVTAMGETSPFISIVLLCLSILLRIVSAYFINKIGFGIKEFAGNMFDRNSHQKQDDPSVKNFKIQNLEKSYGGTKKALSEFSIEFEKGNIYAILGHNGAGKSTLFNVLTGLIGSTSGTAILFGNDILADNMKIRELSGVCHQDDILFPTMNAQEHFQLYCDFKGVDLSKFGGIETYTLNMLSKVGLEKAKSQRISEYSGGMKRRLCLILATVGNPSLYFLDEPTAGLDPLSKKLVWNVIESLKKDAIVLLTSHDMEEAETLASQVIIMAGGKKVAMGAPLILKNEYAKGLRLIFTKVSPAAAKITSSTICDWVKMALPFSRFVSGTEECITFGIPKESVSILGSFLDLVKSDNLLGWSLGSSTLEEVFFNCISNDYNQVESNNLELGELKSLHSFEPLELQSPVEFVDPTHKKSRVKSTVIFQLRAQSYKIRNWLYNDFVILIAFAMLYCYFSYQLIKFYRIAGNDVAYYVASSLKLLLLPLPFVTSVIKKNLSNGLMDYQVANGAICKYFWSALLAHFAALSAVLCLLSIFILPTLASFSDLSSLVIVLITTIGILGTSVFIGVIANNSSLVSWSIVVFSDYARGLSSIWWSLYPPLGVLKYVLAVQNVGTDQSSHFYLTIAGSLILLLVGLGTFMARMNVGKGTMRNPFKTGNKSDSKIDIMEIDAGVKQEIENISISSKIQSDEAYRLVHLGKRFGSKIVVDDVTLRLLKNETFGLLGISGAGKTTTIAMIVDLVKPTSGHIDLPTNEEAKAGFCPQRDNFFDFLSVEQHLRYYSMLNGVSTKNLDEWVSNVAERALLDKIMLGKFPEQLSGGMRRRVTFAISLASGRRNLILDEPTVISN